MQWIIDHRVLVLSVLLGISEALALIPSIGANGIVQGAISLFKSLLGADKPQPPSA